jgi:hypothetical protein
MVTLCGGAGVDREINKAIKLLLGWEARYTLKSGAGSNTVVPLQQKAIAMLSWK